MKEQKKKSSILPKYKNAKEIKFIKKNKKNLMQQYQIMYETPKNKYYELLMRFLNNHIAIN